MPGSRRGQEAAIGRRSESVFINRPFAESHVRLFLAYVVGAKAIGLSPRAAIEVYDARAARLERIQQMLAECAYSFHDVSFVNLDSAAALPRFNMPFELGMAVNEGFRTDHSWYIFDSQRYQAQTTISDLNGREVLSHGGSPEEVLRLLANNVVSGSAGRNLAAIREVYDRVSESVFGERGAIDAQDFFTPRTFQIIAGAAAAVL